VEGFNYRNKKLYCEGTDIKKIAEKIGTPFYVYSGNVIEKNYMTLEKMLTGVDHIICYACKVNSNLSIFKMLKGLGCGADIISGGELFKAQKSGIPSKKIVFAGVGKTEKEIMYALEENILLLNVESFQELSLINKVAGKLKKKAPVSIRVNWGLDPHTHRYINTSKGTKFGFELKEALRAYQEAKKLKNIEIKGIHSHIGSNIKEHSAFLKTLEMSLQLAAQLKKKKIFLKYINLGGGLGISYKGKEKFFDTKEYGKGIRQLLGNKEYTLIVEPGRFIAGNAGALITKVLYTKRSFGKNFVIVDAGMNDMIRPALYGAYHNILPVFRSLGRSIVKTDVVGPICETGDFFALGRKMFCFEQNDLLGVMDTGAYGYEMSSNYNSRPRVAQVLVNKNKFKIIKKRETYEDLVKGE